MAIGVLLKETMSGWLQLNEDEQPRDFAFSIRAFTTAIFRLSAPRYFKGTVLLDGEALPCHGELTIHLSGPAYWLEFRHPELGHLRVEGKKNYGHNGLLHSLVHCPMKVYRSGEALGVAEVSYRGSMLAFPFTAVRLVAEEKAYPTLEPGQ